MITTCPCCGWVRPLHPSQEMRSCPCGWSLTDWTPSRVEEEPVQLTLEEIEAVA